MGDSGITSAEVEGFTVTTNSGESSEEITEQLQDEQSKEQKPDLSDAASKLGKKGAEAKKAAKDEKDSVQVEDNGEKVAPEAEEKPEEKPEEKAAAEDEEDKKDKRKGNPRHDPRARMLEATRQAAEAKRDRDAALARVTALEERLSALEAPTPKEGQKAPENGSERLQSAPGDRPKEEDFNTYGEYLDARDEYNKREWFNELREEQQRTQMMEAQDRKLQGHIDEFRSAVTPDVDKYSEDVLMLKTEFQLQEGEAPDGSNWIANELVFSPESAPALMLHLSEHPEELQRIAALPTPRDVSREMAKLETRLTAAPSGTPSVERDEAVSKAHPPVKPVTGAPSIDSADPAPKEGESFDSWYRRTKGNRAASYR